MEISQEQRYQATDNASDTQMALYADPESGERLSNIATKHSASIANYNAFAIAVGDVILGLVPQEKLPDLLIERLQITRPEAMKVTADVLDFLAPLSQTVAQPKPTPISDSEVLEVEMAQAEADLHSTIQPIRTMAHDMEVARNPQQGSEPVHQASSQADLLQKNQ